MKYKLGYYQPIAVFAIVTSQDGRLFKKLPLKDSHNSKQYQEIEEYEKTKKAEGKSVLKDEITITQNSPFAAFLKTLWNFLTPSEKELVVYSACHKIIGKPFYQTSDFGKSKDGTISPFYFVDDNICLNSRLIDSSIRPLDILGMIEAIPFEIRKQNYLKKPMPKSILGFESFEELGCRIQIDTLSCKNNSKLTIKQIECMQKDSVQSREYRLAQYSAINTLLSELENFSSLPAADMSILDREIEKLLNIENDIDDTLDSIDFYRDIELIEKINDSFNRQAELEGRHGDIVDKEVALKHFGFEDNHQEYHDKNAKQETSDDLEPCAEA